jgi:outer membrane protein OmpA-like peptidoglycan-associated protein
MVRASLALSPAVLIATMAAGVIASGQAPTDTRPLRVEPGLVVVSAINDKVMGKDYESVGTTQSVDAAGVREVTDWAIPDRQSPDGVRRQSAPSMARAEDALHARRLILWYQPGDPETIPGSTGPTPSADVFSDILTKGEAAVVIGAASTSDSQGLGMLGGLLAARKYFRGTVRKLGVEPVRVIVDGVPAALSTVHVGGTVRVGDDSGDVAFWWLDDKDARFALRFSFQGSVSQVVKIDRPKLVDPLAGLATPACRSDVPGIYFLSDSAELLPASQPAIQRIADTLKAHADWAVTIEGHTDNTGSDQHNLDLSQRRAAALKSELTAKYGVAAARLQTAGYGRTRPVDTNDTMDGRAHNRRVEISRRC